MKLIPALAVLIMAASLARADMVIVQKVDGMGQAGEMTMKISDDKVRSDVSPQVSTITNVKTGDVITIMHAQKAYMVMSAAMTKAMFAKVQDMQKAAMGSATPSPLTATGKTDKINGWNASEYTFSNGIMKGSYWVSTEFPNAQAVKDALDKFKQGGLADMTKAFSPDLSALPGVPVKTVIEVMGKTVTTEMESAKEQKVDPADFQVPPGYTEIKMPVPGAMPPAAPAQ